jgi:hypothetical protein
MARLHYGPTLHFELDPTTTRQVTEMIGAHATRGGWISFTDEHAKQWSILVTPGIPIWVESDPPAATGPATTSS